METLIIEPKTVPRSDCGHIWILRAGLSDDPPQKLNVARLIARPPPTELQQLPQGHLWFQTPKRTFPVQSAPYQETVDATCGSL